MSDTARVRGPGARPPGAPLRIANCSGYYGDRLSAAREMVEGGPIDVLTGDYLAELTMLLLWKARQRDPDGGYAVSFLAQMRDVLGTCLDRGIKIVASAGGLNPAGLARRLREAAAPGGLHPSVAHVEGDDLLDRLPGLQARGHDLAHLADGRPLAGAGVTPVTANAYLGGWGIAEALRAGADVVICGRATDASLVVGPAAWAFGWALDDWDRLAGAVTAGHIIECGTQATGGNYSFFTEIPDPVHPGFPIAEVHADGSSVITKHPGTGGAVTVGTVTAQLLYEIGHPSYLNADVVARFDTVALTRQGPDRVAVGPVAGDSAPATLKVCLNHRGGYRSAATCVLTGLDLDAKADFAEAMLLDATGGPGGFAAYDLRREHGGEADRLTLTVKDADPETVGRGFFAAVAGTALAGYPGLHLEHAAPKATEYGVYWPALVPAAEVPSHVVLGDGTRLPVPRADVQQPSAPRASQQAEPSGRSGRSGPASPVPVPAPSVPRPGTPRADAVPPAPVPPLSARPARPDRPAVSGAYRGRTVRLPLGTLVGARSGDKGGDANVGLWATDDETYAWLREYLAVPRLRGLLPETARLQVSRYELANLRALNFVVHGLLGDGVAASTSADPQAKALGERLRGRLADIPERLLDPAAAGAAPGRG
ncbi:acyclic terpene utilization AtuA family protein [Actinacidiphila sp. ITFR-21]|uniref:acyclic terpene utilization AtuA family protein n=1 Tax=Actinacidiphila sp. ITFR-21 TaxID=3075199 RepID=UPI00288B0DFF|nr:acyclic terpene utilization AtuA family protein [Streptomyces sp. ITFR-21]WNI14863.1 acyclic terpene utilization AtuA family protein [Streptomyces sp. ITFR-21]